jgi:hypothetical protein
LGSHEHPDQSDSVVFRPDERVVHHDGVHRQGLESHMVLPVCPDFSLCAVDGVPVQRVSKELIMETIVCQKRKIIRVELENRWHYDYPEDHWSAFGEGETLNEALEDALKDAYELHDDFREDGVSIYELEQIGYGGKFVDFNSVPMDDKVVRLVWYNVQTIRGQYEDARNIRMAKKREDSVEAFRLKELADERKQYEKLKAKFEP